MKKYISKYLWVVILLVLVFLFVRSQTAEAEPSSFGAMRKAMPEKLEVLRAKLDDAGGGDMSLAFFLSSQNEDARLVSSTVLVYQNFPRERRLGVLLGAAIRYNEDILNALKVEDMSLADALSQAPEEMAGITQMFQTVEKALNSSQEDLKKAVNVAHRIKIKGLRTEEARRNVTNALTK
ncbi:MAG: hypothetical protein IJP25_03795 [Elusimicrobiaceae bacterium]|nr:hypothetical protein [Elusimicrobiaceae bacterium]